LRNKLADLILKFGQP